MDNFTEASSVCRYVNVIYDTKFQWQFHDFGAEMAEFIRHKYKKINHINLMFTWTKSLHVSAFHLLVYIILYYIILYYIILYYIILYYIILYPIFNGQEISVDCLTPENATYSLPQNVCNLLQINGTWHPERAKICFTQRRKTEITYVAKCAACFSG